MTTHTAFSLGVDIGGGTTRVALIDANGGVLAHRSAPTPAGGDASELLRMIDDAVTALREASSSPVAVSNVIGVVLPGIYDRVAGVVVRAVNLPKLESFPLRDALEERLRCPVYVDTDVVAAGWAQWRVLQCEAAAATTAADGPAAWDRFVYLSIGTGIGGCVILDGRIVRHTRGGAGHLGHLIVDSAPDAPVCRCGARGCLEQVVCGALRDSPTAAPQLARPLALGLLQIAHLYAPTRIALGGGVIEHSPALLEQAAAEFKLLASQLVPRELKIIRAPLRSDDAGVSGAALLAQAQLSGGHPQRSTPSI